MYKNSGYKDEEDLVFQSQAGKFMLTWWGFYLGPDCSSPFESP